MAHAPEGHFIRGATRRAFRTLSYFESPRQIRMGRPAQRQGSHRPGQAASNKKKALETKGLILLSRQAAAA